MTCCVVSSRSSCTLSMLTSSRDERTPYRSTSPAASFPKRVGSSFGSSSDDREKLGNTKLTMVQVWQKQEQEKGRCPFWYTIEGWFPVI